MKKLHTTYEHRGVQFTCTEEAINDTKNQPGMDLLVVVRNAIDNMLLAMDQESGDFKVKAVITKDSPSPTVVGYNIRVIRI